MAQDLAQEGKLKIQYLSFNSQIMRFQPSNRLIFYTKYLPTTRTLRHTINLLTLSSYGDHVQSLLLELPFLLMRLMQLRIVPTVIKFIFVVEVRLLIVLSRFGLMFCQSGTVWKFD
jgi:hypothetical protein